MTDKSGVGTFVDEAHERVATASLVDLFEIPPVEQSLIRGKQITLYPSANLTSEGPIEFTIPSDPTDFTALNLTRLEGEIEINKADGTAIADTDKISIVNLFPQSLYKQIECFVNDVQINDLSTPTYHYKSFIETHLSYDTLMKDTTLKACELYQKDDVGKENIFLTAEANNVKPNSGFVNRRAYFKGCKLFFSIILHIDFFQCPRYLIPGCEIKLKFIRADDNFSLLSDGVDAKIKFNKLKLKVRRITADSSVLSKIEANLSSEPAIYPICKSVIKTQLLNKEVLNHRITQIIRGKLPRSFIVCFVKAKGYDGFKNANPFVFENFTNNYLNVYVNNEPLNPTVFQPNFTTGDCIREYRWFLDNIGLQQNTSTGITFEEFKSNSCFFPFDLSPDWCNSVYLHGIENGTIDIDVGFTTAPTENIYAMVYASYDEIITIDKNRNIVMS